MTKIGSPILTGLAYAFGALLVITVILSLFLVFTQMKEETVSSYVYVVHGIAVLIGGYVTGKRAGHRGWYFGAIHGVLYCLAVIITAFLGFDSFEEKHSLILFLLAVSVGALGGILGVNRK